MNVKTLLLQVSTIILLVSCGQGTPTASVIRTPTPTPDYVTLVEGSLVIKGEGSWCKSQLAKFPVCSGESKVYDLPLPNDFWLSLDRDGNITGGYAKLQANVISHYEFGMPDAEVSGVWNSEARPGFKFGGEAEPAELNPKGVTVHGTTAEAKFKGQMTWDYLITGETKSKQGTIPYGPIPITFTENEETLILEGFPSRVDPNAVGLEGTCQMANADLVLLVVPASFECKWRIETVK